MAPKVINVNGWTGCPYYQKAKMLASTLVLLYPGKFQVFKNTANFRECCLPLGMGDGEVHLCCGLVSMARIL
jgi:hypothetical protein